MQFTSKTHFSVVSKDNKCKTKVLEKFQTRFDDLEGNRKEGKEWEERSVAGAWSPHDGHYAKSP